MTRKILLVDDETTVRNFVKELLTINGYMCDDFKNGVDALKAFRAQPGEYQLVITDQTMPEMLGTELVAELLKVSDVPIILYTGYSDVVDRQAAMNLGVTEFFMKPFASKEFIRKVEQILLAANTSDEHPA